MIDAPARKAERSGKKKTARRRRRKTEREAGDAPVEMHYYRWTNKENDGGGAKSRGKPGDDKRTRGEMMMGISMARE